MTVRTIKATEKQMQAFGAQLGHGGRVTMLNLLKYKESADYKHFPDEPPRSGREAYKKYMEVVRPCLESVGGRIVFSGPTTATVIGPEGEEWDDMILVEYPAPQSLTDLMAAAEYQAIEHHRDAALEDSRLISIGSGPLACE
jgi:uncharacterized protein (DUF1330 family)